MGPTVFPFWRLSPRSIPVQSTTTTTTTTTTAAAAAVTLGPFHRPPLAVLSLFVCLAFVSAFSIRLELWCSVFSVWWCWLRFYRFVFVSRFIFRWFFFALIWLLRCGFPVLSRQHWFICSLLLGRNLLSLMSSGLCALAELLERVITSFFGVYFLLSSLFCVGFVIWFRRDLRRFISSNIVLPALYCAFVPIP